MSKLLYDGEFGFNFGLFVVIKGRKTFPCDYVWERE
jgi:hypothetical protein